MLVAGTPYQLFNVGLRLTRLYCPNVTHLNISGCGLVSNHMLELLDQEEELRGGNKKLQVPTCLKSLIMLTYYEDTDQVQTCKEKLLLEILQNSHDLECVSLEGNFSTFFNDSFLCRVMRKNLLTKLRILDIRGRPNNQSVPMTMESAKLLVNLPNIQILRMNGWNVTDDQFEHLKAHIKSKGWNLMLTKRAQVNVDVVIGMP